MDLYADLPLAKGAKTSSALDADGKPKTSTSSLWAKTPLMVPQAAKNKSNNKPTPVVTSSTSMLPSALAGRQKSPTTGGISIAFKPASVIKRTTPSAQVLKKKTAEKVQQQPQKQKQMQLRAAGFGLGFATVTEVRVAPAQEQEKSAEVVNNAATEPQGHFFQATYRDEYHPSRPNSYEMYCKERLEKKELEKVKRELGRRQREQEREGKLERERLAKDLAEGRAPAMEIPAPAGRGRGMTMPAWMRKKIEENAAVSQPESERDDDHHRDPQLSSATEGQFDDASEPRGGLGFSTKCIGFASSSSTDSSSVAFSGPSRAAIDSRSREESGRVQRNDRDPSRQQAPRVQLDEFGREIRESKRRHDDQRTEQHNVEHGNPDRYHRRSSGPDAGEKRRRTSGWDSRSKPKYSSSRVVLLLNMVGPGEVDDELQDEVKGECTEKYGPVAKCVIYEVTGRVSPEEAVRIFVQFRAAEDATKALTGLNGRFFGGRKVKAVYYEESKFDRMDLTGQ